MPRPKKACHKDVSLMTPHNRNIHLENCTFCRGKQNNQRKINFLPKNATPPPAINAQDADVDGDQVRELLSDMVERVIQCEDMIDLDVIDTPTTPSVSDDDFFVEPVESVEPVTPVPVARKCTGYRFMVGDPDEIYRTFPFTLIPGTDMVFENGSLHHANCVHNHYRMFECDLIVNDDEGPPLEDPDCNKVCNDLQYSKPLRNIISNMQQDDLFKTTINNKYLSHMQLENRLAASKELNTEQRLTIHTQNKKIARLNRSLEYHQRFMHLIRHNNIHRLHDVVQVALNQGKPVSYVVNKVTDAVQGNYNPHYQQDDKDLAFLILQFGGPALLDIVHRAIKLPSSSTAYRMLKDAKMLNSSITASVSDLASNINLGNDAPKYGFMMKIDEHYTDKRARWCPNDNQMYGLCYDHARNQQLCLETWDDIMNLKKAVDNNEIHLAKECMVIAIGSNSTKINAHPIVVWPTCSKDEVDIQCNIIQGLSNEFLLLNDGCPLMCWATDGDNIRRQIFDKLMRFPLKKTSAIYHIISNLKFIDTTVGLHEETVDFDAKHLAKRLRNYFIGANCKFGSSYLYRKDIKKILALSPEKPKHSIKELVNPHDKQNVGMATEFLYTLSKGLRSPDLKDVNMRVAAISDDLIHYADIIDAILSLYAFVQLSIEEQLKNISTAAFTLLCLFRKLKGSMIPTQLYHDLQSTFENSYFCAAKYQMYHPDLPLFLFLLGTDVLERIFGNMRMKNKSGFDCLDMIYMCRALGEISRIMDIHPDWMSGKTKLMSRLCLDYSNPSNWDSSKLTLRGVNIPSLWEAGRQKAELSFLGKENCDFFAMMSEGVTPVTLLKPNGKKKVGLTPLDCEIMELDPEDESLFPNPDDDDDDEPESSSSSSGSTNPSVNNDNGSADAESSVPTSSIIDYIQEPSGAKHDNQIIIEGEYYFKASVVRQLFDSTATSNDRLKRVRGLSRYVSDKEDQENLALDNILMLGDPVLVFKKEIAIIQTMTSANKKVKILDGDKLQNKNIFLEVRTIELEVHTNEFFVWTGKYKGSVKKVAGSECNMIQPTMVTIDEKPYFAFDRHFIIDFQVQSDQYNQSLVQSELQEQSTSGYQSRKRKNTAATSEASQPQPPTKTKSTTKTATKTTNTKKKIASTPELKWECKVCKKTCTQTDMRAHVGQHILNNDVSSDSCGWCGLNCYSFLAETGQKKRGVKFYKPNSQCAYFWPLGRKPLDSTKQRPCTNYIEHCTVCGECVWKYGMSKHFEERHETHEAPQLDREEVDRVKNIKYKS